MRSRRVCFCRVITKMPRSRKVSQGSSAKRSSADREVLFSHVCVLTFLSQFYILPPLPLPSSMIVLTSSSGSPSTTLYLLLRSVCRCYYRRAKHFTSKCATTLCTPHSIVLRVCPFVGTPNQSRASLLPTTDLIAPVRPVKQDK